jgi:hypothetical protein
MSKLALDPINFLASSGAPTLPTIRTGDTYYDTSTGQAYVYNGTAWVAMSGGGSVTWNTDQNIIANQMFS